MWGVIRVARTTTSHVRTAAARRITTCRFGQRGVNELALFFTLLPLPHLRKISNRSSDAAARCEDGAISRKGGPLVRDGTWSLIHHWGPFWHGLAASLALPFFGGTFFMTLVDAAVTQVLPVWAKFAAGTGLVTCFLDAVRSLTWPREPCMKIELEESRGVISASDSGVTEQRELDIEWVCASMRGWRPGQEDSHAAMTIRVPSVDSHGSSESNYTIALFGVFDGHGGWQVSSLAKSLLPKIFEHRLEETRAMKVRDFEACLRYTIEAADSALLRGPLGIGKWLREWSWHPFSRIGSTSCVVLVDGVGRQILVANTGDSRAVFCDEDGEAIALSDDHKPEDVSEYTRIFRAGGQVVWTGSCYRVDGCLNLSRALGDFYFKGNSGLPANAQKVISDPTVVVHKFEPSRKGEFLLIACDGIFERMTRHEAIEFIRDRIGDGCSPGDSLRDLLHACCASTPTELGQDNETAILVRWKLSEHQESKS